MTKISFLCMAFLCGITCLQSFAQPNIQWIKNYGGLNGDSAYSIRQLADGGYIVAGQSSSTNGDVTGNHGGIDYWVARLAGSGNLIWQKTYGGSGTDIGKSVVPTTDGGFIIVGYTNSYDGDVTDHTRNYSYGREGGIFYGDSPYEGWIIKINSTGVLQWTKSILYRPYEFGDGLVMGFQPENFANKIVETSDGNFLIPVYRQTMQYDVDYFGWSPYLSYLLKINTDGNTVWESLLTPSPYHSSIPTAVTETASGYSVVLVGSEGTDTYYGGLDVYLANVTTAGSTGGATITFLRNYGGSGNDSATIIRATADGGLLLAGQTNSTDYDLSATGNHGDYDYWLLKLNSIGDVEWSKTYGGSNRDAAWAIQEMSGAYFIAGTSLSSNGDVTDHRPSAAGEPANADCWVIKTNTSGDLQWAKSYGGNKNDAAYDLIKTAEGGFALTGVSNSNFSSIVNKGSADFLILKFIECGSLLPPNGSSVQKFCSINNPLVSNLVASAAGKKWYDVASGGTALELSTALTTGTYYVTQNTGGCESARKPIAVTVTETPGLPVASAQSFSACIVPTVSDLTASGTGLKWYTGTNNLYVLPPTYPLRTAVYYVSQSTEGCTSNGRTAVQVTVTPCSGSRPITKNGNAAEINSAATYPNPTNGTFKMFAPVDNTVSKITVQVTDIKGTVLLQKICMPANGILQENFDLSRYPSATYIVKYFDGKQLHYTKVVLIK